MLFNPWLTFALLFLAVWLIVFLLAPSLRKEMLWVSIFTMPFGLTEPLFVPEYWTPPSLFNLAARTGFDIESLIWCFAVGGLGAVLYEALFRMSHRTMSTTERRANRQWVHPYAILSIIPIFLSLELFTSLNPIYSSTIAMVIGAVATAFCRPDLIKNIIGGGLMFLTLYFTAFFMFTLAYPGIIQRVWNLPALSGIIIVGIPIEELLFAFAFGLLWSSVYEHIFWLRLTKKKR
jgi:hypothetical protein